MAHCPSCGSIIPDRTINVSGLDKARILKALYDHSKPQGMGFLAAKPGPISVEECQEILANQNYVDYLHGRIIKTRFDFAEKLDPILYDRDNGVGAAEHAILNEFT
jgi:hypothetical protein